MPVASQALSMLSKLSWPRILGSRFGCKAQICGQGAQPEQEEEGV